MFDSRILLWVAVLYLGAVSLVSAVLTVWDKRVSKIKGHRRVPERTLLLWAALGGGVVMYLTMLLVSHKTRHPKFMVGIPVIIIAEFGVFLFLRNTVF